MSDINIEMDTLNSFGDEGAYYGHVTLELEIPIEDVLYCSNLIGNRAGQQDTMETGEWIIINRSPTGVRSLPIKSIRINEGMWKVVEEFTRKDAEKFIKTFNPIRIRPSQCTPPNNRLSKQGVRPTFKQKIINKLLNHLN